MHYGYNVCSAGVSLLNRWFVGTPFTGRQQRSQIVGGVIICVKCHGVMFAVTSHALLETGDGGASICLALSLIIAVAVCVINFTASGCDSVRCVINDGLCEVYYTVVLNSQF